MDTCFSNFKNLFNLGSARYSYGQKDVAHFYARYRRLMAHWHNCLPGRILDVNYDRLAQDPEREARRVTDFLGFDWKPECLEFYKSSDAVATASAAQIREPISTAYVQRWKKFEAHLGPLKNALDERGIEIDEN